MDEDNKFSNQSSVESFVFRRDEDLKLYTLLVDLIGDGSAKLFRDACYILELDDGLLPSHKVHLVAHLLRELESSVLGIIKPLTVVDSTDPCKALISDLGLKETDPVAEAITQRFENDVLRVKTNSKAEQVDACLGLLNNTDETLKSRILKPKLHKHAHRKGLSDAKSIDDEFREGVRELVLTFLDLLRLCEASFPLWHQKIDRLLKNENCPKKLQSELPRNIALMGYLFGKLDKPGWFSGLKCQGFFECGTTVTSQQFPQIHYLIKVANKMPVDVLEVMLCAKSTDQWLYRLFNEAAIQFPLEQAELWAKHITVRMKAGFFQRDYFVMGQLQEFMLYLIECESHEVFPLVAAALEFLPEEAERYEHSSIRMSRHEYQKYLAEVIPELARFDCRKTIVLLSESIKTAVKLNWPLLEGDEDYSTRWLLAIEDHPQNSDFHIEGLLALALRKIIEQNCSAEEALGEWLGWLKKQNKHLYSRIAIHLVRVCGNDSLAKEYLLNKDLFDEGDFIHEYLLLLQKTYPRLSPREQNIILGWIDEIPERKDAPEEFRLRHKRWQQYRRLRFIEGHLSPEWKKRLLEVTPSGSASKESLDRLSFDQWTEGGFVDDKSPVTPEQLALMSVEEMVDYLLGDISFDRFQEVTSYGLEKAITSTVKASPEKYIAKIDLLKNSKIRPSFIRGITNGLVGAGSLLSEETIILDWMTWCMEQISWSGESETQNYNDNKKRILSYLDGRMRSDSKNPMSLDLRKRVFTIIREAFVDPDPDPQVLRDDYHAHAINCVRGNAMESALIYGLWVMRDIKDEDTHNFDDIPELRDILEERLNLEIEGSPSVRSAIGLYLPQICWMDSTWVAGHLDAILPREEQKSSYFDSVWRTYLTYCRCYDLCFDILRSAYEHAVAGQKPGLLKKDGVPHEYISHLANHLVWLYARKKIELNEDGLICRFMKNSDAEYQKDVLRDMGRILLKNDDLSEHIPERFQKFFEWWVTDIAPESSQGWGAFSKWFCSKYLEREWKIKHLVDSSKHDCFRYDGDDVLECLEGYFDDFPSEVTEILENYISHQLTRGQGWVLERNESIEKLLTVAHLSQQPGIKSKADQILGRLVKAGYLKFRSIWERE